MALLTKHCSDSQLPLEVSNFAPTNWQPNAIMGQQSFTRQKERNHKQRELLIMFSKAEPIIRILGIV